MASRWMAPKLAKMKRAKTFSPHNTINRAGWTIEASNHVTAQVATLREKFTGVVTLCEEGKPLTLQGKGKRQRNTPFALEKKFGRDDGRGARVVTTAETYYSRWEMGDRLMRNGVVVG